MIVATMTFGVTDHAVNRYIERLRPALSFGAAKYELIGLIPQAQVATEGPDWDQTRVHDADAYLMLGDDVALVVKRKTIVTVLTKGWCGVAARKYKTAKHRKRKAKPRDKRGGRPPVPDEYRLPFLPP